jgi:hypothetical protein
MSETPNKPMTILERAADLLNLINRTPILAIDQARIRGCAAALHSCIEEAEKNKAGIEQGTPIGGGDPECSECEGLHYIPAQTLIGIERVQPCPACRPVESATYRQEEKDPGGAAVQRLVKAFAKEPFTIAEARKKGVCRICQIDNIPSPRNPLVLNYGEEYAHQECLDARICAKCGCKSFEHHNGTGPCLHPRCKADCAPSACGRFIEATPVSDVSAPQATASTDDRKYYKTDNAVNEAWNDYRDIPQSQPPHRASFYAGWNARDLAHSLCPDCPQLQQDKRMLEDTVEDLKFLLEEKNKTEKLGVKPATCEIPGCGSNAMIYGHCYDHLHCCASCGQPAIPAARWCPSCLGKQPGA